MSMVPWVSYRPGTLLVDECQIAFLMSCLMLRVWTHLFYRYFQCHLSYHEQFVWYPGYNGYQFCGPLASCPFAARLVFKFILISVVTFIFEVALIFGMVFFFGVIIFFLPSFLGHHLQFCVCVDS